MNSETPVTTGYFEGYLDCLKDMGKQIERSIARNDQTSELGLVFILNEIIAYTHFQSAQIKQQAEEYQEELASSEEPCMFEGNCGECHDCGENPAIQFSGRPTLTLIINKQQ